jgi:hypothetical protein
MDEDGVRKVAALLLPARFPFHGGRCSPNIVRYALQARPATEPRRADGSQLLIAAHGRYSPKIVGFADLQARAVTEARRADARRSCKRAFVYRTSRSFAGKCPHRRTTKSGGRKPPVVTINAYATAIRTPSGVRRTIALVSAQTCFPHPRRADGRRSWLHTRLRLPIGVSDLQERYVTHGGLTPAALVNVRFCTANVAIFQRTGVVHQERLA